MGNDQVFDGIVERIEEYLDELAEEDKTISPFNPKQIYLECDKLSEEMVQRIVKYFTDREGPRKVVHDIPAEHNSPSTFLYLVLREK